MVPTANYRRPISGTGNQSSGRSVAMSGYEKFAESSDLAKKKKRNAGCLAEKHRN